MWNHPANDLSKVALRIKTKDFVEGDEKGVDLGFGIKD
jgi:hypothetical protein